MTSIQPRFWSDGESPLPIFGTMPYYIQDYMSPPPYRPDTRERDQWLREFTKREPHLSGILGQVVTIDKNRGWSLTGGRNSVAVYDNILRTAENGEGWRRFMSKASQSYHTSNLGSIVETSRDTIPGSLRGLYHIDNARCKLVDGAGTLYYYPRKGRRETLQTFQDVKDSRGNSYLTPADYFRMVSMPTTDENLNGIGLCAIERCLQLAQLMISVLEYDYEKLGSQAPKGLLLLHNISETQWRDAMTSRKGIHEGREQEWFGAVAVLASSGIEQMDAKLFALSQLPDGFDRYQFIEFLIYGYALAFGYDAGEFWPKMRGGLGHSVEVSTQHKKATGKGGLDFLLEMQTQLQMQLPSTVHFEFDQRDDEGELIAAKLRQETFALIDSMFRSNLISREEGRFLMAEEELISHAWTQADEDVTVTDTDDEPDDDEIIDDAKTPDTDAGSDLNANKGEDKPNVKQMLSRLKYNGLRKVQESARDMPEVRRAAEERPSEPIVKLSYDPTTGKRRETVIWESGYEMMRPTNWRVARQLKRATLLEDDDLIITDEDVDTAIEDATDRIGEDIGALLNARPYQEN